MNCRVRRKLAAVGAFLALLVPSQAGTQDQKADARKQKEWTWKDRERKTRTRAELEKIFAKHKLWVGSGKSDESRADLSYADLRGADLSHADLPSADLSHANLFRVNLNAANLNRADLSNAGLSRADLGSASLESADLTGADLWGANLNGAILDFTHLTGANLRSASLSHADLSGADLSHAGLSSADLSHADLSGAELNHADLWGAHLNTSILVSAHLIEANLHGADLSGANLNAANLNAAILDAAHLTGANLLSANLSHAGLPGADLTGASLCKAILTSADLSHAKLSYALLVDAELKDAIFSGADLKGVTLEPKSIPEIRGIAAAEHLEFLKYDSNPDALVQLRKLFQENGFRIQERKITYALSRRKAELDGPVERWFQRVAFDLTCQYGMNPGRALQIWLALMLFCWLVYAVFIHVPGASGIYRIQRPSGEGGGREVEEKIQFQRSLSKPLWRDPLRLIQQEFRAIFWGGFFSLMSAFNIGFRDINFGRWLRLLPRTEYDLKAKGWARTVAGFQSLISVYLIALWVLTYFGEPFER